MTRRPIAWIAMALLLATACSSRNLQTVDAATGAAGTDESPVPAGVAAGAAPHR